MTAYSSNCLISPGWLASIAEGDSIIKAALLYFTIQYSTYIFLLHSSNIWQYCHYLSLTILPTLTITWQYYYYSHPVYNNTCIITITLIQYIIILPLLSPNTYCNNIIAHAFIQYITKLSQYPAIACMRS